MTFSLMCCPVLVSSDTAVVIIFKNWFSHIAFSSSTFWSRCTQYEVRFAMKFNDASAFFFATSRVLFAAACRSSLLSS